ncbi:MAG: MBL fold metallo-hydrolase [Candidatus Lokiarchaeota archaeon]|nr:MBL fold metallo-hydrolase [Candidatus Lokiarchaeota archaeon]
MKLTILGSGDCSGTPQLGCSCRICKLARKVGQPYTRTRFGILIETNFKHNEGLKKKNILIDTSPDLRFQLINVGVEEIDAIFFTHADYDHSSGIFELYRTHSNNMYRNREKVKIISGKDILDSLNLSSLLKILNINLQEIDLYEQLNLFGLKFQSFGVLHKNRKKVACRGYKITTKENKNIIISGDLGLDIPERTFEIWNNPKPDLLILEMFTNRSVDFLKGKHLTLTEVRKIVEQIRPKKTVLVHISHLLSKKVELLSQELKKIDPNLELSYDGMTFEF